MDSTYFHETTYKDESCSFMEHATYIVIHLPHEQMSTIKKVKYIGNHILT